MTAETNPLTDLSAIRFDAYSAPESLVLPLSKVPVRTVILALLDEVEAVRSLRSSREAPCECGHVHAGYCPAKGCMCPHVPGAPAASGESAGPAGGDPRDALRQTEAALVRALDHLGDECECESHPLHGNYECCACEINSAIDAVRALSPSSDPALAEWYEADGSVTMLPAEEVARRRKLAAKVIGSARIVAGVKDRDLNAGTWWPVSGLRSSLQILDAAPSSDTGSPDTGSGR